MSDALLKEISTKLSDIHALLAKGGAPAAAPAKAADKAADKSKDKPAADKSKDKPDAGKAGADKAKAGAGAPAGTKAPGGKHTIEEVRDILRTVATNPALGKTVALSILDENGGVDHLTKLKPENYDAVYEAAQVELKQQKQPEGGSEDDDDGLGL